jgi:hypothetical protein
MSDDRNCEHWVEIEYGEVECPRKHRTATLHECMGCPRFESLAMDPAGKHVYVDCKWDGPEDPTRS